MDDTGEFRQRTAFSEKIAKKNDTATGAGGRMKENYGRLYQSGFSR